MNNFKFGKGIEYIITKIFKKVSIKVYGEFAFEIFTSDTLLFMGNRIIDDFKVYLPYVKIFLHPIDGNTRCLVFTITNPYDQIISYSFTLYF